MPPPTVPSFKAPDLYAPYPQQPAVAAMTSYGYTSAMHLPAQDRPAQIRQEAAERVAKAERAYGRTLHKLLALALVLGILIGFAAGILVADRWLSDRQVIFIPANGTKV